MPGQKPKVEKEKNQNIQVVVRCRPLNSSEKKHGSYNVLELNTDKKEVSVKDRTVVGTPNRTFTFDRLFGPHAKQIEVYKTVVSPIVEEVLMGYNCTVFAYGQTGTGKTFTMEGEKTDDPNVSWEDDPLSGVIPRAMHQVFTRLKNTECEFSVRVSFLEIYNEELIDLLGAESVENPRLKIYEDTTRKGSCVIQGLEEVVVHNKNEVYHILERGAQRRQTAATLMNAHSSRSHSVFMVTIHIKENSVDGEELLKTGKLNLVDLAGSECIGKSGAVDRRAREAGNINQSLLTLGRVITALVEHAPHIPYRESKLTRLLQDSLGGRTKTSIIATVSPASSNLDETLSTLDYAYRAKNITNRPEINQKLTKRALLKEYTEEIERLRRDLQAARDKNGIYLAMENYEQMTTTISQQSDSIRDLEDRIQVINLEMVKLSDLFSETKEQLVETTQELQVTSKNLEETTETLTHTKTTLYKTRKDRDEQCYLVKEHVKTEGKLHSQATKLLDTVEGSTTDVFGLHDKLDRKRKVEDHNEVCQEKFNKKYHDNIDSMEQSLNQFTENQLSMNKTMHTNLGAMLSRRTAEVGGLCTGLTEVVNTLTQDMAAVQTSQQKDTQDGQKWVESVTEYCSQARDAEVCRQFDFQEKTFIAAVSHIVTSLKQHNESLEGLSQMLQTQMKAQQDMVQQFAASQQAQLSNQRQMIAEFNSQQMNTIDSHIHHTSNMLHTQQTLNQTLADRLREGMNKLLDDMINDQHSHLSHNVSTLLTDLGGTKNTIADQCSKLISGVDGMTEESQKCDSRLHEQSAEHNTNAQTHIDQLKGNVDVVVSKEEVLLKDVDQFTKETQDKCKDQAKTVLEMIQEHSQVLNANLEKQVDSTKAFTSKLTKDVEDISAAQTNQQSTLQTDIKAEQNSLEKAEKALSGWSDSMSQNLKARDEEVQCFLAEEMLKDVPTGLTPQRRDFVFPRNLIKTNRHSLVLANFRKDYTINEAISTPLPDDSLNDSQASQTSQAAIPVLNLDEQDTADSDHNTSADSAVSSSSMVSSNEDMQEKLQALDDGKENTIMGPPRIRSVSKTRANGMSSKVKAPRSRTPTPKKTGTPTSVKTSGTKKNTPSSAHKSTRLPLRTSNP